MSKRGRETGAAESDGRGQCSGEVEQDDWVRADPQTGRMVTTGLCDRGLWITFRELFQSTRPAWIKFCAGGVETGSADTKPLLGISVDGGAEIWISIMGEGR